MLSQGKNDSDISHVGPFSQKIYGRLKFTLIRGLPVEMFPQVR